MRESRGRTLRPGRVPRPGQLAAVGLVLLALGACGSESTGLTSAASAGLHERVGAVRVSATKGDPDAARAALDAFRAEVHRLVDAGELDPGEAVALLAQADRVAAGVDAEVVPAATPEPTPATTPRPVTRASRQPERSDWSEVFAALLRERLRNVADERRGHERAEDRDDRRRDRDDDRHDRGKWGHRDSKD